MGLKLSIMIYVDKFRLPSQEEESRCFSSSSPTYFNTLYPFQVFPHKKLSEVQLGDITIFCGSNGSGKTTLLNVISEKLGLKRESRFNKTELYDLYIDKTDCNLCIGEREKMRSLMETSRIITSDDVFDHILDVRTRNENIDFKRKVILERRSEMRNNPDMRPREINFSDSESVQAFKDYADMTNRNKSASWLVKDRVGFNERTYSNGENAFKYFTDAIQPGGLYLLDEPENSLSAERQIDLSDFILGMARHYQCQFIISSHSPFVLATPYARIYDMDSCPVCIRRWTEIPSIRLFRDFFENHREEFED